MANNQRTIAISVEVKDGKVILNQSDFSRLLNLITTRDVVYETSVSLRPKEQKKRGRKPKKEE